MAGSDGTGRWCSGLMNARWTAGLLLAAMAGGAAAEQDAAPDEAFLAYLGGLGADEGWGEFFDSVPANLPGPLVAEIEGIEDVGEPVDSGDHNGQD
jgi:hypothetical protein